MQTIKLSVQIRMSNFSSAFNGQVWSKMKVCLTDTICGFHFFLITVCDCRGKPCTGVMFAWYSKNTPQTITHFLWGFCQEKWINGSTDNRLRKQFVTCKPKQWKNGYLHNVMWQHGRGLSYCIFQLSEYVRLIF